MKPIGGRVGGILNGLEVAFEKAYIDPLREKLGQERRFAPPDPAPEVGGSPHLPPLINALPGVANIAQAFLPSPDHAHGGVTVQPLGPSAQPITADELQQSGIGVQPHVNLGGVSPAASEAMRAWVGGWGGPMPVVNSAFRDAAHNAKVGGAKGSQHLHGNAFDISTAGWTLLDRQNAVRSLRQAGFTGIGVYDNSIHADVGPARTWGPDYTRNTAPAWAL